MEDRMKLALVYPYWLYMLVLYSASNTCGSSVAGVILQDLDTVADLEQVSKFNSTNQNMCSDAGTYPGVFSDRIIQQNIPTQDSKSTTTSCSC